MSDLSIYDGAWLRSIRQQRGESQEAFAVALNRQLGRRYDKSTVSRWEGGHDPLPAAVTLSLLGWEGGVAPAAGGAVVVAVANQKGGVGKTTSAINIGYALARSGFPTLLVDLDPQANATVHVGLSPWELEREGKTLYQALLKGMPVSQIVQPACPDPATVPLYILPSSLSLAAADAELIAEPGGTFVLRERLEEISSDYAFVIIDCPPHLGLLTVNALAAADQVLIPTQAEALSTMGIPLLMDTIGKVQRRGNPRLSLLGILPTMVNPRLTQDRETLDEIAATWGARARIFDPVVRTTLYPKAAAAGRPTLEAAPDTKGIEAYELVATELIAITRPPSSPAARPVETSRQTEG